MVRWRPSYGSVHPLLGGDPYEARDGCRVRPRSCVDRGMDRRGWAVDALLGEQTRLHADLDVVVRSRDVPQLQEVLPAMAFGVKPGGTPTNFVLLDPLGREVDVHAITFDDRGYGLFHLPDGRKWPVPPSAFRGKRRIAGREVRCLSAETQVQCHGRGYAPTQKDLRDMELLQARFGVVLPLHLCRQDR
jgi:lincosamide nucleotidyltransferase A/C/D/E